MRPVVVVPRSPILAVIIGALLLLVALVAAPLASAGTAVAAAPAVHTVEVASAVHSPHLSFERVDGLDGHGSPADSCVILCTPVCAGSDTDCVPPLAPPTTTVAAPFVRDGMGQVGRFTSTRPVDRSADPATPSLTLLSIRRI